MNFLAKRLALGFGLIVLASGILLATDRDRRSGRDSSVKSVALLQHASTATLDESVDGVIAGLAEHGYHEGVNLRLTRYNAHNEFSTATAIAREIVNRRYDLVITVSTISLQCVASANKVQHMPHVFGMVADPFACGVGLDRAHPEEHPPYLVGQGIFSPVEESFDLAKQMFPGLKRVGVVWNPAELNSRLFLERAQAVCPKLGIQLLEAPVESSAGVLEAVHGVIGRGAQAIWVGGDVTVLVAIKSVTAAASREGIPVFTIIPGAPDSGALFDIGVSFYECGKLTGALAADILNGTDPATVPIRDVLELLPRRLIVNQRALAGLKEPWTIPEEVLRSADILVDDQGVVHERKKQ